MVQNAADASSGAPQAGQLFAAETEAGAAFASGCPQAVQNFEALYASLPQDVQTAISGSLSLMISLSLQA
ncbi:MAG TPA: hypothetical protein VGJ30_00650, partial [Candidatus Angelobacter sp.]